MKKIVLCSLLVLACQQVKAQTDESPLPPREVMVYKDVFTMVEQMPSFPGGEANLLQYLKDNIKYPEEAMDEGVEGKVFVKFIVTAAGEVVQAKSMKPAGHGFDEEAVRVVSAMPKWTPGKQNGRAVNVYFQLPVYFRLEKEKTEE